MNLAVLKPRPDLIPAAPGGGRPKRRRWKGRSGRRWLAGRHAFRMSALLFVDIEVVVITAVGIMPQRKSPDARGRRGCRAFLSCLESRTRDESNRSRSTSVGSKFQTPILIASKTEFGTGVLLVRSRKLSRSNDLGTTIVREESMPQSCHASTVEYLAAARKCQQKIIPLAGECSLPGRP